MLISEQKPIEEILTMLEEHGSVFLVGCSGCAEVCETGGDAQVTSMAEALTAAGKEIAGRVSIDFLCSKALVGVRLMRRFQEIECADALLVMSCGIGVQAVAAIVDKPTYPADNTLSLGGAQGVWRGEERCAQCGDCVLGLTGGICPVTACSKNLMNGPCGGYTQEKKCEVDETMDCGWLQIYERMKKLGRLDQMKRISEAKDYQRTSPPARLRSTTLWAVEQ